MVSIETNDYEITVRLFGKEILSLAVNSEVELNGSKPLMFLSFIVVSAAIAGLMFASLLFTMSALGLNIPLG